jgi:anti-sigma-K factor RskA
MVMKTEIQEFLKSNKLERYVIGDLGATDELLVEHYISTYSEVQEAYETLQRNLEVKSKFEAVKPPQGVLARIEAELDKESKVISLRSRKKSVYWYSIAASVAAFLFATTSVFLFQKNKSLVNENNVVIEEIYDLRKDIKNNNEKLNELADELSKLNDPDSKKYVLTGNERAKNLRTVAYINPVEKTSMIDVITLPQLPEEQYYQMWAEFQDKMVNLGVLDASERKLRPIPYMENAVALSITIENKDGKSKNEDNQVAEISLKNK